MDVFVRSRMEMERILGHHWHGAVPDNIRVISVIDPGCDPVFQDRPGVLTLVFDDIKRECPEYTRRRLILFNEEHARQVLAFLKTVLNYPLYVHCTAGVARSGAIATFATEFLHRDFRERHRIQPNPHVLKLLRLQLGTA